MTAILVAAALLQAAATNAIACGPKVEVQLLGQPDVADGAEAVTLRFQGFHPGRIFMFVIDVDDRLEKSDFGQAVISGSEIAGAAARAELVLPSGVPSKAKGVFGPDGRAVLTGGVCA